MPFTFSNGVDITLGRTIGNTGINASVLYGVNTGAIVRGRYGLIDRGFTLVTEFTHN